MRIPELGGEVASLHPHYADVIGRLLWPGLPAAVANENRGEVAVFP